MVYSDYSYLCSSDLQTLQAYRSCNVDHGCLCSHLNPPSRFPNTSRARLDTYIRNFLLFALQIYLMIDTIYRNLHYFHQAFSMLFYIQIPEGNHAGRFNGVYSDYSYLCSNDLQTLPAYRSCNVDHGCLCSHLNPPSRFFNTSRAPLDTYIRHFLLFTLCNLFNH